MRCNKVKIRQRQIASAAVKSVCVAGSWWVSWSWELELEKGEVLSPQVTPLLMTCPLNFAASLRRRFFPISGRREQVNYQLLMSTLLAIFFSSISYSAIDCATSRKAIHQQRLTDSFHSSVHSLQHERRTKWAD